MKNKKIIARILALCGSLLLVFSLALPCFADEVPPLVDEQKVIGIIKFDTFDTMENWYYSNISNIYAISVYDSIYFTETNGVFTCIKVDLTAGVSGSNFVFYEFDYNFGSPIYIEQYGYMSQQEGLVLQSNYQNSLNPSDITFYYYTNSADPNAPTRSGLYGNLFNIIKDAIFGQNALLDASQEFTLTQIATVMTYVVLLLPFIVVGIIFFKLVRL